MSVDNNSPDKGMPQGKLKKIIDLLKSLKTQKPDYDNPDFSNWRQTEEEYQQEQQAWLKTRKKDTSGD